MYRRIAFVLALAALLNQPAGSAPPAPVLNPPASPIPSTLFGMHIHNLGSSTPWPQIQFHAWRLWDAHVAWMQLEPNKGTWDFSKLDLDVEQAQLHDVELLLTLGMTPKWASARPDERCPYGSSGCLAEPSDIGAWRDYVRTVATRYKGKIHAYEIWNEPNAFFTGRTDQMVTLTREAEGILKAIDPQNIVVSPSATAGERGVQWLGDFLDAGGGNFVDVIAFHFYVSPQKPEAIAPLSVKVRAVMQSHGAGAKPLWNTETGYLMQDRMTRVLPSPAYGNLVLDEPQQSAYVARAYIVGWASGISRFYWYAWDDGYMGQTEADGKTLKPSASAYGEIEQWLVGGRMVFCGADAAQTWTCQLNRNNANQWIVWNANGTVNFTIPANWQVRSVTSLSGEESRIQGSTMRIGISPILVH